MFDIFSCHLKLLSVKQLILFDGIASILEKYAISKLKGFNHNYIMLFIIIFLLIGTNEKCKHFT